MPVKSLEAYLFERGLAGTYPIEILRNSRLGIDVNHYLTRLVGFKKELQLDAIGGFPKSLKQYIESDLKVFQEYNITPVFVLSGCDIVDQYKHKNSKELSPSQRIRNKSWALYQTTLSQSPLSSLPINSAETFRDSYTPFTAESIVRDLIDYFIENDLDYIVAPYVSWVQLSYIYDNGYIDAIYGPTETLLLPNVEKFILGMEFPQREFRFVDKRKVLNDFRISQVQLLDIAVSVGCDLQPLTLPIYANYPQYQLFEIGLEIIYSGNTIYGSVLSTSNDDVITRFQRGVLSLQYMPIFKRNGRVEISSYDPTNPQSTPPPDDVYEIIGERLPHEYYFYQSIGLIGSKILESVLYGQYFEKAPLDGGFSLQYKKLINSTIDTFKNKEINLLTTNAARYYQVKKIKYVKWYDNNDILLENKVFPPIFQQINHLVVKSDIEKFTLSEFLTSLKQNENLLSNTKAFGTEQDSDKLSKGFETISTSLLRTLFLLKLIEVDNFKLVPNKWTRILFKLTELDQTYVEQYLVLLIFLKLNAFKLTDEFTNFPASSIAPYQNSKVAPESRKLITLISRLASMLRVEQKNQNYQGPLSRPLLSYRSSIDLVKTNLRELLECVLVNSLSHNEVTKLDKTNKDWRQLSAQIPFSSITANTILGIVYEKFLELYFLNNDLSKSKTVILDYFNSSTASILNINEEFSNALRFFKQVYGLISVAHEEGIVDEEVFNVFNEAIKLVDQISDLKDS